MEIRTLAMWPRLSVAAASLLVLFGTATAVAPVGALSQQAPASPLSSVRLAPAAGASPAPSATAQLVAATKIPTKEVAIGRDVSIGAIGAITFVSASRGYGLAKRAGSIYTVVTTDGGKSWQVVGDALYRPTMASTDKVDALSVGAVGAVVAFGGSEAGTVIDVSDDSGAQWWRTSFAGSSVTVSWNGTALDVIVNGPKTKPSHFGWPYPPPPPDWLYVSNNGGMSFRYVSTLPAIGHYSVLVSSGGSTLYALHPGGNDPQQLGIYGGLARSTDGGASWTTVTSPCSQWVSPRFGNAAQFGAVTPDHLWMVCGQDDMPGPVYPPSIFDVTVVMYSSDGGDTWSQVASTGPAVQSGPVNFPVAGGVPLAGMTGMSLFGATDLWLVLNSPNVLLRTSDSGATWQQAPKAIETQGPQQVAEAGDTVIVRTKYALWSYGTTGVWKIISKEK